MFNLLVKFQPWANGHDTMPAARAFEDTDQALRDRFKPEGQLDCAALIRLPALLVQETSGLGNQIARVGTITQVRPSGYDIALDYVYDPHIPPIPNAVLATFATELGTHRAFSRTHWAIKDIDLYRVLVRHVQQRRHRPIAFQLNEYESIDPGLVAVMMPFEARFNNVYAALQHAAAGVGLRCQRADDIWENHDVIQDVVSLIDRARVVVCDCTARNPNVFYEMGIAHTLGRDVIPITQAAADIPFDVYHHRYLKYLNNSEGLADLIQRIQPRLTTLLGLAA